MVLSNLNFLVIKTIIKLYKKYIELLNGLCKGIIRSQYDKIKKMNVKTIVYSDVLL